MKKTLNIRQATEADLRSILLFEFRNRAWFAQYLPYQALHQQTEIYVKQLLRSKLNRLQYLVLLSNGVLIGRFNVQVLDRQHQTIEVSYRIAKTFANQGIAQFVLKRLLLIWASHGVKEVYAQVADHNKASMKVLLKCGFEIHEIQSNAINLASTIHDCWVFRWAITEDAFMRLDKAPVC